MSKSKLVKGLILDVEKVVRQVRRGELNEKVDKVCFKFTTGNGKEYFTDDTSVELYNGKYVEFYSDPRLMDGSQEAIFISKNKVDVIKKRERFERGYGKFLIGLGLMVPIVPIMSKLTFAQDYSQVIIALVLCAAAVISGSLMIKKESKKTLTKDEMDRVLKYQDEGTSAVIDDFGIDINDIGRKEKVAK